MGQTGGRGGAGIGTPARKSILQKPSSRWIGMLELEKGAEFETQLCDQVTLPLGSLGFPSSNRTRVSGSLGVGPPGLPPG